MAQSRLCRGANPRCAVEPRPGPAYWDTLLERPGQAQVVSMVTCFKIRARALWLAVLRTVSGVQFQWCSPETTLCGRAGLCLIDDPSRIPICMWREYRVTLRGASPRHTQAAASTSDRCECPVQDSILTIVKHECSSRIVALVWYPGSPCSLHGAGRHRNLAGRCSLSGDHPGGARFGLDQRRGHLLRRTQGQFPPSSSFPPISSFRPAYR